MLAKDKLEGALLGLAIGDALGMPIEGLGHQNIRLYYKGIKEYRDDEKRGQFKAGQWTGDTQLTLTLAKIVQGGAPPAEWPSLFSDELVRVLAEERRWGPTTLSAARRLSGYSRPESLDEQAKATCGAIPRMLPVAAWQVATDVTDEELFSITRALVGVTHLHPLCSVAAFGHLAALRYCMLNEPGSFFADRFWEDVTVAVRRAEEHFGSVEPRISNRLEALRGVLSEFPLDIADVCDGAGAAADEAWPFAIAMVARTSHLPEAAILSGINSCVDSDSVGAMTGSLIGALHGRAAFPAEWIEGLEASGEIKQLAERLHQRLAQVGV